MSKQILRDVMVRVNGIDISPICHSISLDSAKTEEEVTIHGSEYRQHIQGLEETQIDMDLWMGTDGAAVVTDPGLDPPVVPGGSAYWNGLLFRSLFSAGSTAVLDIALHNAVPATTNPWSTVSAILLSWNALAGGVGEPAAGSLSFKSTGAVTLRTV